MALAPNERLYRERIWRRVRHVFRKGMKVLDAGCGPGGGAELLAEAGCRVTAVDVGAYAAAWAAREKLGIDFRRASAEALDFPDASFDGAWMMDALHHMAWPEKALAELLRVTRPGGPVAVIETNRNSPLTFVRMTLIAGHETFGRGRLRRMLQDVDPAVRVFMVETRCLPWGHPAALACLAGVSDVLEAVKILDPWLTYTVGLLHGAGRPVEPKIDARESPARREARARSEAIACKR